MMRIEVESKVMIPLLGMGAMCVCLGLVLKYCPAICENKHNVEVIRFMSKRNVLGLLLMGVLLVALWAGGIAQGNAATTVFLPAVFKPEPPPPPFTTDVKLVSQFIVRSGLPSYNGPARVTSIRHAGDNRLFMTEREGYIHIAENNFVYEEPFLDIRELVAVDDSFPTSEQGLLSLAFHPDYAQNGYFFISYVEDIGSNGRSVIARFQVSAEDPYKADPESFLRILTVSQPTKSHNGGNIVFGPDGYLYLGLGDGTRTDNPDPKNNAQNMQSLLGKIVRIDVNHFDPNAIDCGYEAGDHYSVPSDNPFVDNPDICNEIWASGLRNPWRFSFDRLTGDLYIADVGMHMREEVNFAPAGDTGGQNYGWRCYEGGVPIFPESCTEETLNQITLPVMEFDHATQSACSITGGHVYRGEAYPQMVGHYFWADFCYGYITTMVQDPDWQATLRYPPTGINISTFGENVAGELFVVDYFSGVVYQIQPDS